MIEFEIDFVIEFKIVRKFSGLNAPDKILLNRSYAHYNGYKRDESDKKGHRR